MSVRRNTVEHQQGRSRDDVQIGVRDLGPIADGQVDLRPLTVFVGPSNTGKTYMSILIYALHQVLGGFRPFPTFPRRFRYPYYRSQARRSRSTRFDESSLSEDDYSQMRRTLAETRKPFMYHDLPIGLRSALQTNVKDSGAELELELNRCFDSAGLSELVRTWSSENDIKISLQAPNSANVSWHMNMSLSDGRSTASGEVEDFVLIPEIGRSRHYDRNRRILSEILVQNRKAPVFLHSGRNDQSGVSYRGSGPTIWHSLLAGRSKRYHAESSFDCQFVGNTIDSRWVGTLPSASGILWSDGRLHATTHYVP